MGEEPDFITMFDLNSYFSSKKKQINAALYEILEDSSISSRTVEAMRYSLMAGGKRLRPILCLAAAEAVGGRAEDALRAACSLEMIHTYSLIHDDLPAIDNDDRRRGKPTCHLAFDEATAIFAGDALMTLAFQILASTEITNELLASKWLKVIHTIALAAGYKGMLEGQTRDMAAEGASINLDDLNYIYSLKTGALIEASVCSGAILGRVSSQQIEQLNIYSKSIGLAYQIIDDILNVKGNSAVTGKAVGTDNIRQKSTYPSIMGIDKSKEIAQKLVNRALQSLDYFDNRSDPLRAIARYVIERKK